MQKRFIPWIIFLILAISLVGLLIFVRIDREEISALRSTNDELSKKANVVVPVVTTTDADYRIIAVKNLTWNSQTYQFIHRCKGTVEAVGGYGKLPWDASDSGACVGENQLALVTPDAKTIVLQTTTIPGDDVAVNLKEVKLISMNGTVLISYDAAEVCADLGCPTDPNHVTSVFHLNDLNPETSFHVLKNYPISGQGDWNSDGTKAIFYPDTMNHNGASGSDGIHLPSKTELVAHLEAPLIGYDLATDTVKTDLTTDKAAYYYVEESYALNKKFSMVKYDDGSFLPTWITCVNGDATSTYSCGGPDLSKWIDNDNYEAVIAQPNGTVKKVEVKF